MRQGKWCRHQSPAALAQALEQMKCHAWNDRRWRRVMWCLGQDPRGQVRQLAARTGGQMERAQGEPAKLYRYERVLWSLDYQVAGVDEVGRGCLAGPVVASAVLLPRFYPLDEVADSKVLSAQKRNRLYQMILDKALAVSIGCAPAQEVDDINVYQATRKAMSRAVEGLAVQPDHLLVDAIALHEVGIPVWSMVRGDARSGSIAAASIVAKVTRDGMMETYHEMYPQYGFARHKGYATPQHLQALREFGPCPLHRRSFRPVWEAPSLGD